MILVETKLKCADNSGAKILQCIRILGNFKKRYAKLGDVVLVAVKKQVSKKKIKKKKLYLGLIIRTKKSVRRNDGTFFSGQANKVLLLNEDYKFLGTRVYGYISKEVRSSSTAAEKYKKIISYAKATL